MDIFPAIEQVVLDNLEAPANELLAKTPKEQATEEMLRKGLNYLVPSADHVAKIVGVSEEDVKSALEIVVDQYLKGKVSSHQKGYGGMILTTLLLNSSHSLKDENTFAGEKDVDVVTLDSITGLDGEEIEFTESGGKRFVPSFDSKEDGKYILHYFVKDTEDKALLKLTASYDHNTKVVKADGFGWERCSIRIDLK